MSVGAGGGWVYAVRNVNIMHHTGEQAEVSHTTQKHIWHHSKANRESIIASSGEASIVAKQAKGRLPCLSQDTRHQPIEQRGTLKTTPRLDTRSDRNITTKLLARVGAPDDVPEK